MTLRPRPASKTHTWDDRDRRNMLMNIGFGLTIAAAVLLLVIAAGVAWYGEHLATAGSVNGQTITRDDYAKTLAINTFRVEYQRRRINSLLAAGRMRSSDATARLNLLDQRDANAATIALEQLVDGIIQAELAGKQGVAVVETDIDTRFTEEATTPELRHAWMIEITPDLAEGGSTPSDATIAAAKAKAAQALTDLKAGKSWEEIAKAVSTNSSKDQGGDLGFVDKNAVLDAAFTEALQALAVDAVSEVVEGADGSFRIGRVTEIVAPVVDATLADQLKAEGIGDADFRAALRRDVFRARLNDAIVAQYLAPGPQRKVAEIYMAESTSETAEGAIKVRHILYSPNDDPNAASTVAADDPAWAAAETAARAAYEKLKADPTQFDAMARAESDEGQASTSGGKLPYLSPLDAIDPAFAAAVFKQGLTEGQLLEPVKSSFGWHLIQVMHYPTDVEWAGRLTQAVNGGKLAFGVAARDNSDKASAENGGSLGWIGKGQLSEEKEKAVFAAPVGKVSEPYVVQGDGLYLFYVSEEVTRAPDADQKVTLKSTAFSLWYSKQKAGYTITREETSSTTTG